MADSDKILSLLIQVGVLGANDVKAFNELLQESKTATTDLATSMPPSWEGIEKEKSALKESGEEAEGSAIKHRALHAILEKGNEIVPGLGTALGLLAKGYHASAEAAETQATASAGATAATEAATAANRSFVVSMGPLAIAFLAIQAASTYWDLYKEKAKEAAEAQAVALDKVREILGAAVKEQSDFNEEMKKASEPTDKFAQSLQDGNALLEAQFEARKKILEADKAIDLAKATTPEQKAEIEAKYAGLSSETDSQKSQAQIQALINVMDALRSEIIIDTKKRDELVAERVKASQAGDLGKVDELTKQIEPLDKEIFDDSRKWSNYDRQQRSMQNVAATADNGRIFAENRPISRAVENFDAAAHGQRLTGDQMTANESLIQLFSQYQGGQAALIAIVKNHLDHSTTQAQEVQALKNALATLRSQVHSMSFNSQ